MELGRLLRRAQGPTTRSAKEGRACHLRTCSRPADARPLSCCPARFLCSLLPASRFQHKQPDSASMDPGDEQAGLQDTGLGDGGAMGEQTGGQMERPTDRRSYPTTRSIGHVGAAPSSLATLAKGRAYFVDPYTPFTPRPATLSTRDMMVRSERAHAHAHANRGHAHAHSRVDEERAFDGCRSSSSAWTSMSV